MCSLHSVYGAILSGVETTFWGIKETPYRCISIDEWLPRQSWRFWSCYKFKQVFTLFSGYKVWRKQGSDWSITENLDQYANYHRILEQTSKVLIMLRKLLLILCQAQISSFSFICFLVEPYVKKIEAGKPMVPFIYPELKSLLRNLLSSTLWSLMFLINVRLVYKWLQLIWIWEKILCLLVMSNKFLE